MDEFKTVVCISCYYKGGDFIDEMHKQGNKVILITSENLKSKPWPWHAIAQVFYMPEIEPSIWNLKDLIAGFAHLMKSTKVDAIIALDDFDVEKAALVRETFRIPGMGQTTYRYFRDKLAMRQQAKDTGINVPEFTSIFNDETVNEFARRVPPPWVLKPRSEASASGIKKIKSYDELWQAIHSLEDERHLFLLESFKPGDVFHVDCLVKDSQILFRSSSQYLDPPMKVSHEGGVFSSKTLNANSEDFKNLAEIDTAVIKNFGLVYGGTHSEYIKGEDGKFYFLETAARIGGAHIPDLIEASTGVSIWREWAKIEDALLKNKEYSVQPTGEYFAGLIVALAKEKHPDLSIFDCDEIFRYLPIDHHVGLVFKSDSESKIMYRLNEAIEKIQAQYLNIIPPTKKPTA